MFLTAAIAGSAKRAMNSAEVTPSAYRRRRIESLLRPRLRLDIAKWRLLAAYVRRTGGRSERSLGT